MNTRKNRWRTALAALVVGGSTMAAQAQFYTELKGLGLGTTPDGYSRNDDESFGPYSLGFALNYFGQTYSEFFLNNNGSVSFQNGFSQFTPDPLDVTSVAPAVAPYWADVDTRPASGGNIYFNTSVADQLIVTWDNVGYYNQRTDLLASFQLVLRGPNYPSPNDEGQIGFFYKAVQWETGDASGGSGGFGGTPATIGFGDGNSNSNPGEISLPGSQQDGISQVVSNQHFWFNLSEQGQVEGSTEENPILPENILPGGTLIFEEVPSGFWVDPPLTSQFLYTITSPGDVFAEIMEFPSGFSNLFVDANGSTYGPFGGGDHFVFPTPVTSFLVHNILPQVDAGLGDAFPLRLRFGDSSASLSMSVPASNIPDSGVGIGGFLAVMGLGMYLRKRA